MKSVLPMFLFAALALSACGEPPDPGVAELKGLTAEQQMTLSAWLKRNPNYSPATDKDCACESELDQYRLAGPYGHPLPKYRPYLQVGDFNEDSQKDVAVIFINTENEDGDDGILAVFNGPFDDVNKAPAFSETIKIIKLGLVYSPDDGHGLGVGHFESEYCPLTAQGKTYSWDCDY